MKKYELCFSMKNGGTYYDVVTGEKEEIFASISNNHSKFNGFGNYVINMEEVLAIGFKELIDEENPFGLDDLHAIDVNKI
ncbi:MULTISPECIES: hypothetical protein [Bacillus cereus group]|uniref:Phage protein n=1 Tax=Bacillus proteolyticus TaxID=2026192 RepID=A0ABV3IAM4_9BACI|nr:hypothetical protein [Bacillus cereus group sp. N8]MBJ8106021.1 hypothetical protein [Bacillus cereus group sp. N8]